MAKNDITDTDKDNVEDTAKAAKNGPHKGALVDIFEGSPWTKRTDARTGVDKEQSAKEKPWAKRIDASTGVDREPTSKGASWKRPEDATTGVDRKPTTKRTVGEERPDAATGSGEAYSWLSQSVLSETEAGGDESKKKTTGSPRTEAISRLRPGRIARKFGGNKMTQENQPGKERVSPAKAAEKVAAKTPPPKAQAKPNAKAAGKDDSAKKEKPKIVEVPVEDLANGLINALGNGLGHTIDAGALVLKGGISGTKIGAEKISSGVNTGLGLVGGLVSGIGGKVRKSGKSDKAATAKTSPAKARATPKAKAGAKPAAKTPPPKAKAAAKPAAKAAPPKAQTTAKPAPKTSPPKAQATPPAKAAEKPADVAKTQPQDSTDRGAESDRGPGPSPAGPKEEPKTGG
jgi:hypothetical protein